jgi:hypothetical protein
MKCVSSCLFSGDKQVTDGKEQEKQQAGEKHLQSSRSKELEIKKQGKGSVNTA